MRMDKYGRELDLILILTENASYTAQQIADRLGITRRNLYYYFDYLGSNNIVVFLTIQYYCLSLRHE